MSTTTTLISEEFQDGDPAVTFTPATGEGFWFKEFVVTNTNRQGDVVFKVQRQAASDVLGGWTIDENGVVSSTTHPLFLSIYRQAASAAWEVRHLAGTFVPDGTELILSEGLFSANEFITVTGIGAIIDSTDEVAVMQLWTDGDPNITYQPALNHLIRWHAYAVIREPAIGAGLNFRLRRQVSGEVIHNVDRGPIAGAGEMQIFKDQDGVFDTGARTDPSAMIIPEGYELTVTEDVFSSGDYVALMMIGREYSTV